MKSGNLNFLEPSGAPRACNGTALPLFIMTKQIQWGMPCKLSVFSILCNIVLFKVANRKDGREGRNAQKNLDNNGTWPPMVRMEDRMPKKFFTQELEGTRKRGRPRKRWKEEVERDLQVLGVRRWRELVADRKKWKDIVRQAKAHSGL